MAEWDQGNPSGRLWVYEAVDISYDPTRIIIQVSIINHVITNIIIDNGLTSSQRTTPEAELLTQLEDSTKPSKDADQNQAITQILNVCRRRYGLSRPHFGNALFAHASNGNWDVVEKVDPLVLQVLKPAYETFPVKQPLPPTITRSEIQTSPNLGTFFSPQTCKVVYLNQEYVAKGPSNWKSTTPESSAWPKLALDRLSCRRSSLRLSHTQLSEWRSIRMGKRLRVEGKLTDLTLREWATKLASVMAFLISLNQWHGDIKPDNVLISQDGNIILADNTRTFATVAFASPELLEDQIVEYKSGRLRYEDRFPKRKRAHLGLPPEWPIGAKELSEVYAYGVTLLVLAKKMSMMDVYRRAAECGNGTLNWSINEAEVTDCTLCDIIKRCIEVQPRERPRFVEILRSLGREDLVVFAENAT